MSGLTDAAFVVSAAEGRCRPLCAYHEQMITTIIEAGGNGLNWGKFLVGRFDATEWATRSSEPSNDLRTPLLRQRGWGHEHLLVLDLETGEGAMFRHGGFASADLNKHRVWVCPMFEPFLAWLYDQDVSDLARLPSYVELPDAPAAMAGYRRAGQGS